MDLTQLTPQVIAVLAAGATVMAAAIAATSALVVASVNGQYTRRIEQDRALRAYKLEVLNRILRIAQRRIRMFHRVMNIRKNEGAKDIEQFADSIQKVRNLRDRFVAADFFSEQARYLPAMKPGKRVVDALGRVNQAYNELTIAILMHEPRHSFRSSSWIRSPRH